MPQNWINSFTVIILDLIWLHSHHSMLDWQCSKLLQKLQFEESPYLVGQYYSIILASLLLQQAKSQVSDFNYLLAFGDMYLFSQFTLAQTKELKWGGEWRMRKYSGITQPGDMGTTFSQFTMAQTEELKWGGK